MNHMPISQEVRIIEKMFIFISIHVTCFIVTDCIENMACSDNVVRAGLTPKFVDVETLCSMLNYKGENASDKIFNSLTEDKYTKLFKPPVKDFAVAEIQVRLI